MPEPLVLTCAADDQFALPMGVMLHSALVNLDATSPVHLFIIGDLISPDNQERLQQTVDAVRPDVQLIWLHGADRLPNNLKTSWCISKAAYLRLLLPELLPDHYGKVLYLDSDLLVESNLQLLWQESFDGRMALAVRDFIVPTVSAEKGLTLYRELNLPSDGPYFNSGVLLLNLLRWKKEGMTHNVFAYLHDHHEHVNLWDQDGLNAVLAGNWKEVDPSWNQQTHLYRFECWPDSPFKSMIHSRRQELLDAPRIIHFTGGSSKPWQPLCKHPAQERFLHYLRESAWFNPLEWKAWRAIHLMRGPEQWLRQKSRPFRRRLIEHNRR